MYRIVTGLLRRYLFPERKRLTPEEELREFHRQVDATSGLPIREAERILGVTRYAKGSHYDSHW